MGPREALRRRRFAASVRREVRPERFAAYGEGALVHPPLTVSAPERVRVGASSLVLGGASLLLGPEGSLTIGARTYLGRDLTVICLGEVRIGDDVMSSDRLFLADTAPLPLGAGEAIGERALADARPVVVEDGAFLGMGAMVLAGVTVGARAVVGAGAVVTRDVPPNAVVVGNPARVVRRLDPGSGAWVPSGSEG